MTRSNSEIMTDVARESLITTITMNLRKLDAETVNAVHTLVAWRVRRDDKGTAAFTRALLKRLAKGGA